MSTNVTPFLIDESIIFMFIFDLLINIINFVKFKNRIAS
jgi:hypothetical protein